MSIDSQNPIKEVKITFDYIFEVNNFIPFLGESYKSGDVVKSEWFSSSHDLFDKWQVGCYPRGQKNESVDYASLFICSAFPVKAKVVTCIVTCEGYWEQKSKTELHHFIPHRRLKLDNVISINSLFHDCSCIVHDSLNIGFKFSIFREPIDPLNLPIKKLSDDLGKLLYSQEFTDITLIAEGKKFPAHKGILSLRCPYFKAMFDSGMKESTSNEINLNDISEGVLNEILIFIYTGTSPNIEELCHELYSFADEYILNDLKLICERSLSEALSINNCSEILLLSDIHKSEELKLTTLNYIVRNMKEVIETEVWNNFARENGSLVNEALCHYVKNNDKKVD